MTDKVVRILSVFPQGSTAPCLVETEGGELFVMKLSGAGPGPSALLTEFLASRIAARVGLDVPEVRVLDLQSNFPWQVGTDEFDDAVQRSAGRNLGVRFIQDASPVPSTELRSLPRDFLACLSTVDRLLQNVDRGVANPNILRGPDGRLWAIDHNACLYLGRIVRGRTPYDFRLPAGHFLASASSPDAPRPEPLARLDRAFLTAIAAASPPEWLAAIGLSAADLGKGLIAYSEAFAQDGDHAPEARPT
jgi:hypothetical protein